MQPPTTRFLPIIAALALAACSRPSDAKVADGSAGASGGTIVAARDAGSNVGGASGDASGKGSGGGAGASPPAGVGADGAAGAAGSDGGAGATSSAGLGDASVVGLTGSRGCGTTLAADDVIGQLVPRTVKMTGLADVYLPGGALAQVSGAFDLSHRPYAVRLPATYDPGSPVPVRFEAGGCGRTATDFVATPSSGFALDPQHKTPMIEVALSPVDTCFLDGGPNIDDRTDSPEVPYFRAVLADLETRYCVDQSRVFVAGTVSGGWEAELLGCAAADVVRATATYSGGLRAHRPPCTGPVAALLVGTTMDMEYPMGPLDPSDPAFVRNDSPGLVPMRDDVLARNGCLGSQSEPWNPALPDCVTFTDCPVAFPVVWCALPSYVGTPGRGGSYAPGAMLPFLNALPAR